MRRSALAAFSTALLIGLLAGATPALAHHSGAMFDTTLAKEILSRTGPETLDHHEHAEGEVRTCVKA